MRIKGGLWEHAVRNTPQVSELGHLTQTSYLDMLERKIFMSRYQEKIAERSVWLTASPSGFSLSMPFFVTESGHFFAESGYLVRRAEHDSFLLLYTRSGCGTVRSGTTSIQLPAGRAVLLDCHSFHEYYSISDCWEFLWVHMRGTAVHTFFHMLYPQDIFSIAVQDSAALEQSICTLQEQMQHNDMMSSVTGSATLHEILNLLIGSSLIQEQEKKSRQQSDAVSHVIAFIHSHYSEAVTLDDMLKDVPVSRYHFIRSFKRITGSTPYHYLLSCRITAAKNLLRSTEQSVSEIADCCGFSNPSSFIAHFRSFTGQKPLQYRKYFRG